MGMTFRFRNWILAASGLLAMIAIILPARAEKNVFVQTFDLLTPVSCEGLSLDGVDYSFTIAGAPSVDCTAGFTAVPPTNSTQPPVLEASALGVMHLQFDTPTTEFGFGVIQNTFDVPQSIIVELFRPGVGILRQEVPLETLADPNAAGGTFAYSGPAVKTVTLRSSSFTGLGGFPRMIFDNIYYFRPPGRSR